MLVEIAATLDRVDRAATASDNGSMNSDQRLAQIRDALQFLAKTPNQSNRSEQLLRMFSDKN